MVFLSELTSASAKRASRDDSSWSGRWYCARSTATRPTQSTTANLSVYDLIIASSANVLRWRTWTRPTPRSSQTNSRVTLALRNSCAMRPRGPLLRRRDYSRLPQSAPADPGHLRRQDDHIPVRLGWLHCAPSLIFPTGITEETRCSTSRLPDLARVHRAHSGRRPIVTLEMSLP